MACSADVSQPPILRSPRPIPTMPGPVLDEDALDELTRGVRELFPVKREYLQPSSRKVEGLYHAREPPQDDKRRSLIFKCPLTSAKVYRPSASHIITHKLYDDSPRAHFIHRCSEEGCDGKSFALLFVRWFDPVTFSLSGARVEHAFWEDPLEDVLSSAATTHFGIPADAELAAWKDVSPTRGCLRLSLNATIEEREMETGDVIVLQRRSDAVYFDKAADCFPINGWAGCDEPGSSLVSHVGRLLDTGLCADVVLRYGGREDERERKCHRAILCQSPFFGKALADPTYDLTLGSVTLPSNLDPGAVTFAIEILYGRHLKRLKCLDPAVAVKVLAVLDYLMMDDQMDLLLGHLDLSRAAPAAVTDALDLATTSSRRDRIISIVAGYVAREPTILYEHASFVNILLADASAFRALMKCMYEDHRHALYSGVQVPVGLL
jgi:hypothetical protein